jgi:hypothetical protein
MDVSAGWSINTYPNRDGQDVVISLFGETTRWFISKEDLIVPGKRLEMVAEFCEKHQEMYDGSIRDEDCT